MAQLRGQILDVLPILDSHGSVGMAQAVEAHMS
jgi:hypothetical protein